MAARAGGGMRGPPRADRAGRAGPTPATTDDSVLGIRRAAEQEAESFLRHVRAGAFGARVGAAGGDVGRPSVDEDDPDAGDVELPSAVQFVSRLPDEGGDEFDGISFRDAKEYLAEHGGPQSSSFAELVEAETPSPPPASYPRLPTTQAEIVVPPTPALPLETPGTYFAQKTEELGRTPWGRGADRIGAHPAFAISRLRGESGRRPKLVGGAAAGNDELYDDEVARQKPARLRDMGPTTPLSRPDSPPPLYTPKGTQFDTPTLRRLRAKHAMREARRIGVRLEPSSPKAGEAVPRMSLFLRDNVMRREDRHVVPGSEDVAADAAHTADEDQNEDESGDDGLGTDSDEDESDSGEAVRIAEEQEPPAQREEAPARREEPPVRPENVPARRETPAGQPEEEQPVRREWVPRERAEELPARRDDRRGFFLSTSKVVFSPTLVHTSKLEHVRLCNGSAEDIAVFASVSPIVTPAPPAAAATCACGRDPSRPFMVTARPVLIKVQKALTVVPHLVSAESAESTRLSLSALQPVRIAISGVGVSVPVIVGAKALHFSSAERVKHVRIHNVGPSDVGWSASLPGDGLSREASPLTFARSGIVKAESHLDLRVEYIPAKQEPQVFPSAIHISFLSHHARVPVLIDFS